ncbi:MAG: hypothetical protein EBS84_20935 [Proteobacteria bacterium]|nr:hypothetical protein [Verrucomicrobiota bacterium]NBU11442.1 hypothetical protein [Pseudomonadota bacterium]NDE97100.1 hypothetical protein [Verrucomicrobiota bacterium]
MKLPLTIIYTNGEKREVVAAFADFVQFERTWSRSVARFEHDFRLTDLAWLAWSAETRAKRTDKKFDPDWLETVETVELGEAQGDTPLATTQPTG